MYVYVTRRVEGGIRRKEGVGGREGRISGNRYRKDVTRYKIKGKEK